MIKINKLNERLKILRKQLNITQKKFGEYMGIKTSTYSDIENGRRELTERNKTLLCNSLNINPIWLETGQGKMFLNDDIDIINELAIQYNLDTIDIEILTAYINLPDEDRSKIKNFIKLINNTKK